MRAKYNVARCCYRWSLAVFFALMNIAVINAVIIYRENSNEKISRKDFLDILFRDLTKPLLMERVNKSQISPDLRGIIRKCLNLPPEVPITSRNDRHLCAYCAATKNRKTKTSCVSCSNLICGEHTVKLCTACHRKLTASNNHYEEWFRGLSFFSAFSSLFFCFFFFQVTYDNQTFHHCFASLE